VEEAQDGWASPLEPQRQRYDHGRTQSVQDSENAGVSCECKNRCALICSYLAEYGKMLTNGSKLQDPSERVPGMGGNEDKMPQSGVQGLAPVRRSGNYNLRPMGFIRCLFRGSWYEAIPASLAGSLPESSRQLRTRQCTLGHPERTGSELVEAQSSDRLRWSSNDAIGMGRRNWLGARGVA